MDNVSLIIESFNDWGKPWTFYKYVINNPKISEDEKNEFSKIYKDASEFELWNFPDLSEGAKNSTLYLKKNTPFTDEAIKQIVNAIAYEWK